MTKIKELLYSKISLDDKYKKINSLIIQEQPHFLVSAIYKIEGDKLTLHSYENDIDAVDKKMVEKTMKNKASLHSSDSKKASFYFESENKNSFILYISTNKKIDLAKFSSLARKYSRYTEGDKLKDKTFLNKVFENINYFKEKIFIPKKIYDKNLLTDEQLILSLKSKNLMFEDEKKAIEYLKHNSYYNIKQYSEVFLDENDMYKENTTFYDVVKRIESSKVISRNLLYVLSRIEDSVQVLFAKKLSKNSPLDYMNYNWVENKKDVKHIDKSILYRARKLFLEDSELTGLNREFIEKYNLNKIPIMHLIEYVSFGDLLDLIVASKKEHVIDLASEYRLGYDEFLTSLHLLKELRNKLAHGNMVLDKTFVVNETSYTLEDVFEKIELIFNVINSSGLFTEDLRCLQAAKKILVGEYND